MRSFILTERPEDRLRNRLVILGFIVFVTIISYVIYGSVAYGLSKIDVYYQGNEEEYVAPNYLKTLDIVCGENNKFKGYVVDNDTDRDKGLSVFKKIKNNESMLFVFDTPQKYSFWMKGMRFPIDIVWLDHDKKIIDIKSSITASTYPEMFYPISDSLYVLEFNAGTANKLKIKIGDNCSF